MLAPISLMLFFIAAMSAMGIGMVLEIRPNGPLGIFVGTMFVGAMISAIVWLFDDRS